MQVILLEKVGKLGDLGDQVNVKSGYGRNFLIPLGKAVPASATNVADFEVRRAELEAVAAAKVAAAQARADKLFGSIGTRDIADAISATGNEVAKSEVKMPEGVIRELGEYDVSIQLHSDVTTIVKVVVAQQ